MHVRNNMSTVSTPYALTPIVWVIRDAPVDDGLRLAFHIKSEDYFAVLTTALGFIEEKLVACVGTGEQSDHVPEIALIRRMRHDLVLLHKEYRIAQKDLKN